MPKFIGPSAPTTYPSVGLTIATDFSHAVVVFEALFQPDPSHRIKVPSAPTAHQFDADLCEVTDKKSRKGKLTFLTGGFASIRGKLTEIDVTKFD